ncbi:MAG: tRNA pseudouridine(38-40) synthase TruA [Candidatus Eisenbacteria bacterium]|uniref:tRNA pseudouridine synthase A n=1 Tax=Eiseniibacteriota bacterium TaxID=2212470 RepID=A0A937X8X1_UNCEI|nr:tRNA pseudouridine(38-40) synthase TruA [Candidatus Eisenbacteria bacterium]
MRTIRLTIEYDGTRFHGWQRQPGLRTVQGELEEALATILRERVSLAGAGRTDAGVHALAQVASFRTASDLSPARIARGASALSGPDLLVREALEAPAGFHARHSARARHYAYLLLREPSALWSTRALLPARWPDAGAMAAAVEPLVGDHDFAAFSCRADEERGTWTRVFYARWEPWPRGLALRIGAARFLYKMVRAIVAHSLRAGAGEVLPGAARALLEHPPGRARRIAPARGLHFAGADYADAGGGGDGGSDCPPPALVL